MKRFLVTILAAAMVFGAASSVKAIPVTINGEVPGAGLVDYGLETNTADILTEIASSIGSATELYKQNAGGSESGPYALSYNTIFTYIDVDPETGVINYVGGSSISSVPVFLLVKDGNQRNPPPYTWYLYNLSALGWTGTETITINQIWPTNGSISHVALYGTSTPVPEPGTLLLLGSGLLGLGLMRRRKTNA